MQGSFGRAKIRFAAGRFFGRRFGYFVKKAYFYLLIREDFYADQVLVQPVLSPDRSAFGDVVACRRSRCHQPAAVRLSGGQQELGGGRRRCGNALCRQRQGAARIRRPAMAVVRTAPRLDRAFGGPAVARRDLHGRVRGVRALGSRRFGCAALYVARSGSAQSPLFGQRFLENLHHAAGGVVPVVPRHLPL